MLKHPENYPYHEVKDMIQSVSTEQIKVCLSLLYGCGVRVSELNQIRGENIKATKDKRGRKILRVYSPTLKNRTDKDRFIPIYWEEERWLAEPILRYKKKYRGVLFPFHRSTIWEWCKDNTGINPHGFRKLRLTHLVTEFSFTDQQLVKFAGWTDSRPAKHYVKLNLEDIVPERPVSNRGAS